MTLEHASHASISADLASESFPVEVRKQYAELLQQQSKGGAAGAKEACRKIAQQLVVRRVTPRLALKLHLATMEEVIGTMGPLSAKQVLTCGDVLVLELMSALAEAYSHHSAPSLVTANRKKAWCASGVR